MAAYLKYTNPAVTPAGLATVYATIEQGPSLVNATTGVPMTTNAGNWPTGAIALSDSVAAAHYVGNVPAALVAGTYDVNVWLRLGTTAALGDTLLGSGTLGWDGSIEITQVDLVEVNHESGPTGGLDQYGLVDVNVLRVNGRLVDVAQVLPQSINGIPNGTFRLVQGRVFKALYNNSIDLVKPPTAQWPNDLSTLTNFTMTLTKSANNPNALPPGGVNPLVITGSPTVNTGPLQTVRFEFGNADTAKLALGVGTKGYDFEVTAVGTGGDSVVLMEGQCTVTA